MRIKVLILSPFLPYPPHDGGRGRIYNLIKGLSVNNDIYLLSFIDAKDEKVNIAELKKYCRNVFVVLRDKRKIVKDDKSPNIVNNYYTSDMIEKLQKITEEINPDIVQVEYIFMAKYINHIKDRIAVFTEHDISSIDFARSNHDRELSEKERFLQWHKVVNFEKSFLNKFDSVIALSENDRDILKKYVPGINPEVIPIGVDLKYFKKENKAKLCKKKSILYIGHFKNYPNIDAVLYFLEEIFPEVLSRIRNTNFIIVGSGMNEKLLNLKRAKVKVIGEVEDVRKYLRKASVFVAPVRLGLGIKVKILEAMACGLPVVATRDAAKGMKCTPGRDILVGKNSRDFAQKVIELLSNNRKRRAIALTARKLIEREYNWDKIVQQHDFFYKKLVKNT